MIDVRTITEEEFATWVTAMQAGFHSVTRPGTAEWMRPGVEFDKTLGCFDGSDIVGTAGWFDADLTLPGGATLPVAAVTSVTVAATHRRQGLLTRMMEMERDDFVQRSIPAGILIASEAVIYGRFGYGMVTEDARVTIQVPMVRWTVPTPAGSVRRCTPAEFVEEAPGIYDRYRLTQPGAMSRRPLTWGYHTNRPPGSEGRGEGFYVLRRDAAGVVDGYAMYRIKSEWEDRAPNAQLTIGEMVAASPDAYVALWQHCTSVDWVRIVRAWSRPLVEPLPYLLADRRAVSQKDRGDWLWLRLVDVPRVLGARTYRVADRLVLEVSDAFGGTAKGTYLLEGGPDGATCSATGASPDLSLQVSDLSAATLGGTPLWPAVVGGRVREHRAGAVAAFDRMFGIDVPPHCNTDF